MRCARPIQVPVEGALDKELFGRFPFPAESLPIHLCLGFEVYPQRSAIVRIELHQWQIGAILHELRTLAVHARSEENGQLLALCSLTLVKGAAELGEQLTQLS